MSASTQKILVVFGATGIQGGSVINSILGDPRTAREFKIRGITRDPSKPNAKALIDRGVECVEVSIKLFFPFFFLKIIPLSTVLFLFLFFFEKKG